jgi:hypothetical protein
MRQTMIRIEIKLAWLLLVVLLLAACGRGVPGDLSEGVRVNTRFVDATANVGYYNSLKLNPTDQSPSIAYYDLTNGDLKYAQLLPNGEWQIQIVDEPNDVGTHAQLAFSSVGDPHIVYYDETAQRPKYAFFNGAEWVIDYVDYPSVGGKYLGFDLDLNDAARMSFIAGSRFNLEYAVHQPDSPNPTAILTIDEGTLTTGRGGNVNQKTNLVMRDVNNDQFPVITYYHASWGLLQTAYYDPTHIRRNVAGPLANWVFRILDGSVEPTDDVGLWSSTALQGNDILHASYYDANQERVKYARVDLSQDDPVLVEVIDDDAVVGQGSSIVVAEVTNQSGEIEYLPIVAYYDATNNDLKVATRTIQGWRDVRVDLRGIVGSFPSMVALSGGQIGVAYRDTGNQALKFSIHEVFNSARQ